MPEVDRITALENRIAELERQQLQSTQMAKVSYVYRKATDPDRKTDRDDGTWLGYVDVTIQTDTDPIEIQRRPFMTMRHGEDKTFWLPSKGELGVLLSPSGEYGNSIFVPGIVYNGIPAHMPEGISLTKALRVFRDEMTEVIDTEAHSYSFTSGDSERFIDQDEIKDTQGANEEILNSIAKSILGALLYPSGVTGFHSPTGPIVFVPTPIPPSAPSPPAGTMDSEGNINKTAASEVDGVTIRATSNVQLVLPAIPVTTPSGAGTTTPGTYTVQITGTINLTFPARTL